jgi:hypothetical protein
MKKTANIIMFSAVADKQEIVSQQELENVLKVIWSMVECMARNS